MMDSEILSINDVDLEDGELTDTSDEVYTPLQRPASLSTKTAPTTPTPATTSHATMQLHTTKMDDVMIVEASVLNNDTTGNVVGTSNRVSDDCQSDISITSSTSSDSSDTCLAKVNKEKKSRNRKRIKRTVMVRINPTDDGSEQKRARFKKYDIWRAALQEDTLTENMRGCDVTQNGIGDRNVENYDFSLHYRLNGGGTNSLKRRLSNSGDELSRDGDPHRPQIKRQRPSSRGNNNNSRSSSSSKHSVQERLGKRRNFRGRRNSSTNSSSDTNSYEPRHIENMEDVADRDLVDVAREMARKLYEEKDDLLVRIVQILGTEIPLEIFKETQRIEAEGGMTIKNRQRRRTPGGVFLFLLKHNESLSAEDQKAIFAEDRQNANKKQKDMKTIMRERKVEELKKRLSEQGAELSSLKTRKEIMMLGYEVFDEQKQGNLSNPPPSPEAAEKSPDYKSLAINHVNNDGTDILDEKPSTSRAAHSEEFQTYEDDFLDVNCGDMDFF